MKYFIAIVPPDAIKQKILKFQKSFPQNGVPGNAEPHITVKSPMGLDEDMQWLPQVEAAVKDFRKFQITFTEVGKFDDRVVFLRPSFSKELVDLHKTIINAVGQDKIISRENFEDENYNPHLTLAGTKWGSSQQELSEVIQRATKELLQLPAFEVDFIRVYQKQEKKDFWDPFRDIRFV